MGMEERIRVFGYARVSTRYQHEDRQAAALEKVPVPKENIFIDKQSGKDFDRTQYRRLVATLRPNDVLYVKSIDRLGRNYHEILCQWRFLTKERKVDVAVLDMPLLDTRRGKDLLGTFVSDVVLQILSFVAENERDNILQRQKEGIAAAKARGVKFGRPRRRLPRNFHEIATKWRSGDVSGTAAAKACRMPLSSFRKYAKERFFERPSLLKESLKKRGRRRHVQSRPTLRSSLGTSRN